jgi:hypothetical protein
VATIEEDIVKRATAFADALTRFQNARKTLAGHLATESRENHPSVPDARKAIGDSAVELLQALQDCV